MTGTTTSTETVDAVAQDGEAQVLFLDRARQAMPDFDANPVLIHQLCAGLEGMPLAIELTAARAPSLGVEGLLTGLADPIRLLQGARTADTRHRSVSALIDWSYQLLTHEEQRAFLRLSTFAGPFDLPAAHSIVDAATAAVTADLVGRLADKNLLANRRVADGGRWRMLDTIRAFAKGQLEGSDEQTAARDRHLRWALDIGEQLRDQLNSGDEWRPRFDAVTADLTAAVTNLGDSVPTDVAPVAHHLTRTVAHLTYARGFPTQARGYYESAAALAPTSRESALDLIDAAHIAHAQLQPDLTYALLTTAATTAARGTDLAIQAGALADAVTTAGRSDAGFEHAVPHRELTARLTEARGLGVTDPLIEAHLSIAQAWIAEPTPQGTDPQAANAAVLAARQLDDPVLLSCALDTLAIAAEFRGDVRQAHDISLERLDLITHFTPKDPRSDHEAADVLWSLVFTGFITGDTRMSLSA